MEKTLICLAIALIVGLLMSRLAKLVHLPAVTAYLVGGLLIGPFCLGALNIPYIGFNSLEQVEGLSVITQTALGFIAFAIGNEFRVSQLKTMGKQAITVGILQAVITTIVVDIALIVLHLINPALLSLPSAITLGAIAAATAPAATLMVVRQYKADGPLTKLLLMVVAIDDAVGLVLFSVSFGIAGGIEKANKIMMPIFFALFVILGIYVGFQPGASEGYRYIFRVDPEAFKDPATWIFALGQAFFSLSVAGNGTLIYGSYLSDEEDIPASAGRVALFDTIAAILAALVIIPAMATTGAQLDQGGPGLLFIFLPNLIKGMPGGWLIAIIFFVAVLLAGMTSLINLYEAPIATVQEKFKLGKVPACAFTGIVGVIVSLLIQGIVSDWMDVLSIYICPLGAGLAGIMFFWVCGKAFVEKQVNTGRETPFTKQYYTICKYFYVPVCFIVLILGIVLGGIG